MGGCCSQKKSETSTTVEAKTPVRESPDTLQSLLTRLYTPETDSDRTIALNAIKDYLETHPEDLRRCCNALQKKTRTILGVTPWPDDNNQVLEGVLKAAEVLMSLGPLHVISIVYEIAGVIVTKPAFLQLRICLYDTLQASSLSDFQEINMLYDAFLTGLIQFCRQFPDQVIDRDISQLQQFVNSSNSSMSIDTNTQKWEELMTLVLDRLKRDVQGTDTSLIEQEKKLLGALCKELTGTERNTQDICTRMIGAIDGVNQGWGAYSQATLEVFLVTVATYQPRHCSQLLRLLLTCLPSRISRNKPDEVKVIIHHISALLKTNPAQIATLTYTPTLLSVFFSLFSSTDLQEAGNRLMKLWGRKTDIQSCIRLLSELSIQHRSESLARLCLSRLKKCIRPRIIKDWDTHIFCENWNQLLFEIINKSVREISILTLQMADFIISVLDKETRIRVNDVVLLSKAALSCLSNLSDEMNNSLLKACKYSYQIWLNFATQKRGNLRSGLMKVVGKLQGLAEQMESIPVQSALIVMELVLAHNLGKYYEIPNMLQFAVEAGMELAGSGLYPQLFQQNSWETIYDSPAFLFHKSDLTSFLSLSNRLNVPIAPLRLPIFDSSLSREGTISLLKDQLDPLEALQSDGSYSDITPLNSGDVKLGFKDMEEQKIEEVKTYSGTTGEETVVRQN